MGTPTHGEWIADMHFVRCPRGRPICWMVWRPEMEANRDLIVEAGVVFHLTGLRPMQLAERAGLLAAGQ